MSFSLFSFKLHPRWISGLACLAIVCATHAADPRAGRPIEITPPRGESINTNVNQLRLSGLKNLEADLSRPFQSLTPKSSLQGLMAPEILPTPQPAPIMSPREKELRDRRKNWVFSSPDEFGPDLSPEKIFGLKEYDANGLEKKSSTALERFSQRLNQSATNQLSNLDSDATNSFSGDSFSSRQNGNVFPTMNPATAIFKPVTQPSTFDAFNFNDTRSPDEILREQKAQQVQADSFRQLWNFDQNPTTPAAQNPGYSAITDTRNQSRTFQPVISTITPPAPAPAQSSSLTPQAPTPTPARTTTFQPDFSAPQRRF